MTNSILVNADWLLTAQRAAIHLPTATAVVADLHLGYELARLRGGDAAPSASMIEQLDPLRQVFSAHGVRRLLVAGDLVEGAACQSLIPAFQTWLRENDVEWFGLAPGNHDQHLSLEGFPCNRRGFKLGKWGVAHGDDVLPTSRVVQGHLHPCFRWTDHAAGACYLISARRIILPAFSADCAGVNVLGSRRWRNYRCCVIAGERVLDMGRIGNLVSRKMARPGKPRAKRFSPGRHQRGF
jgi:putative SbcD/Mre11-related phosphoesterase